jgi:hypothetical protein
MGAAQGHSSRGGLILLRLLWIGCILAGAAVVGVSAVRTVREIEGRGPAAGRAASDHTCFLSAPSQTGPQKEHLAAQDGLEMLAGAQEVGLSPDGAYVLSGTCTHDLTSATGLRITLNRTGGGRFYGADRVFRPYPPDWQHLPRSLDDLDQRQSPSGQITYATQTGLGILAVLRTGEGWLVATYSGDDAGSLRGETRLLSSRVPVISAEFRSGGGGYPGVLTVASRQPDGRVRLAYFRAEPRTATAPPVPQPLPRTGLSCHGFPADR